MASIKFNTLVIYTNSGEILDVLVGTDTRLLNDLKVTTHWDTMREESNLYPQVTLEEYDVQSLSDYYSDNSEDSTLEVRVSYFPNKIVFQK